MSSAPQRPRKYTDESFVIKAVTIGLIIAIVSGYLLNWYLDARSKREMDQAQSAVYRQYLRSTPPQPPQPLPDAVAERFKVRDELLAHPGVKPGPGFASPGVQSTGKAIVDAIDGAQGRQAAPRS
ncbi:hypothetical protein [Comamonas antarctica]|uniref:Uncharacterized protein n=1 Tax=Comamonas antarctica TaxID=2743470 RepID=A0A6N1X548_9BURK|nr:hypothetical protein [Comamonas antarctica]QKV53423.1 hypothetical protein HUK68_11265 [Comamonas antarctica]